MTQPGEEVERVGVAPALENSLGGYLRIYVHEQDDVRSWEHTEEAPEKWPIRCIMYNSESEMSVEVAVDDDHMVVAFEKGCYIEQLAQLEYRCDELSIASTKHIEPIAIPVLKRESVENLPDGSKATIHVQSRLDTISVEAFYQEARGSCLP